jgi:hypothetical protein
MPTLPPDWTVAGAAPWDVHRRWVTRVGRENFGRRAGRHLRRSPGDLDVADAGCMLDLDGILVAIVAVILLVLFVIFILPLLVVAVEVLIGALALLLGLVARIVFRRPWAVDAFAADGTHLRWKAVGWRATTAKVDEVTASLSHGVVPPGAELVHTDAG